MLNEILTIIKEDVDNFLKLKIRDNQEHYVKLVPVADSNDSASVSGNIVCMSLARIENDGTNMAQAPPTETIGNRIYSFPPPIKLNLYVLFAATYSDGQEEHYKEALKRLSHVISFFQAKPVFNPQNTPKLNADQGDIHVEIVNEGIEQQSYLWGMNGGKYLPSILYRIHSFFVQEKQISGEYEPTGERDVQLTKK